VGESCGNCGRKKKDESYGVRRSIRHPITVCTKQIYTPGAYATNVQQPAGRTNELSQKYIQKGKESYKYLAVNHCRTLLTDRQVYTQTPFIPYGDM